MWHHQSGECPVGGARWAASPSPRAVGRGSVSCQPPVSPPWLSSLSWVTAQSTSFLSHSGFLPSGNLAMKSFLALFTMTLVLEDSYAARAVC